MDYLRVVAQALFNRRINLLQTLDPRALSGLARMMAMLRPLLPPLSDGEFDVRMDILRHETVYAFDRWLQRHGQPTGIHEASLLELASHIAAVMAHGMKAPAGGASMWT